MDIIIKNPKFRPGYSSSRIRHDIRIPRYWKNKETGTAVEVRRFLLVDGQKAQVIYFDEFAGDHGHELSASYYDFTQRFESIGNSFRM